jgi:hypothetical protein
LRLSFSIARQFELRLTLRLGAAGRQAPVTSRTVRFL